MKKYMLVMIIITIGILGSCATFSVATPTTIGEITYYNTQDNFLINENLQGNLNLSLAYSEVNESGIITEKMWYDSDTNKTTYKFTTQKTHVAWWFTPSIKKFIFVDENTNNLYQLNVNYSEITIPENPHTKQHRELKENYTMILNDYNLTNSSLANITLLYNELNATYNSTMQYLNRTLTEKQNVSENLTDLKAEFTRLDNDYNTTYALWESAVENVTHYQLSYEGLQKDYNKLEKDHNDLSGSIPWYIFITILGTFLFAFFYLRRKTIFEQQPQTTDEITTGYGKWHSAIDKHILSRLKREEKPDEGKIEEITEWKAVQDKKSPADSEAKKEIPDQPQADILTIVHEKIDANNRAMTKQFKEIIANLEEKVDKIING